MKIYLIRHGKTPGNQLNRYIGITDEPVLEEDQEQLKKQLTIPENLDRMIEEVTRQELEQELHRKIKLKEGSGKEQSHLDETEGVSEPTLMIGEKTEEEAETVRTRDIISSPDSRKRSRNRSTNRNRKLRRMR